MIFVERDGEEPASLSSAATLRQAQDAAEHYEHWVVGSASFKTFTRYREHDVQQALRRMFHGKCAYCEKQLEKGIAEVEHYRPKAEIEGSDHPGYWWLALRWSNLLPTCPGCNKGLKQHIVTADMSVEEVDALQATPPSTLMGKATQFPVGGQRLAAASDDHFSEQAQLIDPTRTDPAPELLWRHEAQYSVVEPAATPGGPSVLGRATIHCVALNRIDLVQSRTAILNKLKAHRVRIMADLERDASEDDAPELVAFHLRGALRRVEDMKLACLPDQPFSAMAAAFVEAFRAELRAWAAAKGTSGG